MSNLPAFYEHNRERPIWQCKGSTFISHYFKTLSISPSPGIEPVTSRSAVKRSTDWANPAVKQDVHTRRAADGLEGLVCLFTLHQRVSQEPYPICDDSLLRSGVLQQLQLRSVTEIAPNSSFFYMCEQKSGGAKSIRYSVNITSSSSFKFIKKNWENTKYDVPLLAVSYSYSRRAVAWH